MDTAVFTATILPFTNVEAQHLQVVRESVGVRCIIAKDGLLLKAKSLKQILCSRLIWRHACEQFFVIRTLPAIHLDQSVSFILEWNGLRFAFSSDTLPNKWWREHAVNIDLAIHECFIPPDYMVARYGMSPSEAVYVGTQGHTSAQAFGKIMSLTEPRHAVCYHFQNDFDTAPVVLSEIRKTYDGPLDLATDFMVWNVTKDEIRTRMAVPNHDSYPAPPQRTKEPPDSMTAYKWTEFSLSGVEPESAAVTNRQIEEFNERNGTDVVPGLTSLPFKK